MKKRLAVFAIAMVLLPIFTSPALADVIGLQEEVPVALVAYLPNSGLEFLTTTVEDIVNALPINLLLLALNPLMAEECYVVASIGAYLSQSHVGDIGVTVSTTPLLGLPSYSNHLYVMFEINKAQGASNIFELTVSGDLLCLTPPYSASAEIDVSKIQVAAAVTFNSSPTGQLEIIVEELAANLVDFSFDIHNFPDGVEDIFDDIIADAIEAFAEDFGRQLLEDTIADALGDVVLSGDTGFGDYTLHYGFIPAMQTTVNGAFFHSNAQLYLAGAEIDPCVDPGWPIGSRYTNNPAGTFGSTTPNGDPYHLVAAFSDDILNQLVYSAFIKGLLCMNPTTLSDRKFTGRDFENLMSPEVKDELDDILDVDWLFAIYPNSVPLIEVGYNGNDLSLVIEDMRFDWSTIRQGRQVELVNARFEVEIGLDIEIDETNNIVITFNNPTVDLNIHSSSFNLLPIEQMEPFLNTLITTFLGLLDDLIPPIPLPSFAGWSLMIQELDPTGNAEDYLAIYLMIESPAKSETDRHPETELIFTAGDRQVRGDAFSFGPADSARYGLSDGREISFAVTSPDADADKYVYRVDGAAWKMLYGDRVSLKGLYEGEHTFEVKAKNDLNRTDRTPATLRFVCDHVAPEILSFALQGDQAVVDARDYQDSRLRYRFRIDNGPWSDPQTDPFIRPDGTAGIHRIEAIAMDQAENQSEPAFLEMTVDGDDDDENAPDDDSDNPGDSSGDDSDPQSRSDREASSGGCGL